MILSPQNYLINNGGTDTKKESPMSIIIKLLRDKQVITSLISILGAIVAACAAGCKLVATDFAFELNPFGVTTNLVDEVSK